MAVSRQNLSNLTSTGVTETPSIIEKAQSDLANAEQSCTNAAEEVIATGAYIGGGVGALGTGLAALEALGIVTLPEGVGVVLEIVAFGTVAAGSLIGVAVATHC